MPLHSTRSESPHQAWTREKALYRFAIIVFACVFLISFVETDAYFHNEGCQKVWYYGSSRHQGAAAELSKIFNACVAEAAFYLPPPKEAMETSGALTSAALEVYRGRTCESRGRVFGSLFELMDAKAVLAVNRWFPLGAKSVSHALFVFLSVACLGWSLAVDLPEVPAEFAFAIAAFLFVAPQFLVFNGIYFRPNKTIAAFTVSFLWLQWVLSLRKPSGGLHGFIFMLATSVCAALFCLADEQAVALVGLFALLAWIRRRESRPLAWALTGSLMLWFAFRHWAEPALAYRLEGIRIIREYSDPRSFVAFNPRILAQTAKAVSFEFQALFGDSIDMVAAVPWLSGLWFFLLSGGGLILFLWRRFGKRRISLISWNPLARLDVGLILLLSMGVLFYFSALRHPPVVGLGYPANGFRPLPSILRGGYYYLPLTVVFWLVLILLLAEGGIFFRPRGRMAVVSVCLAFGAGNIIAVRRMTRLLRDGSDPSLTRTMESDIRRTLSAPGGESRLKAALQRHPAPIVGFALFYWNRTGRSL